MSRLRYLAQVNPPTPEFDRLPPDASIPFVPLEAVWPSGVDASRRKTKAEAVVGYTRFREGDIVVPKITPTFQADRSTIAEGLEGGIASGTTELHVVRVGQGTDRRYIRYLLSSRRFLMQGEAEMIGVAGQKRVPDAWLRDLPVPILDLRAQRVIADYLDTETARIDALIAKKKQLIELGQQRLWRSVEDDLLDLGAEMVPLRRFLTRISDGPFGSSLTSAHYVDAGARVVRLGNIGFAQFKDSDRAFIEWGHFEMLQRHRVRTGDLLIAGLGDSRNHVGRACVAPDLGPAIVKADCYCAGVDGTRAATNFLALFLSSPLGAQQVALAARGTTRSRINLDIAKEIAVPAASLEDQRRIADRAERRERRFVVLSDRLRTQIDLLIEHRQALITASVTGELAIPGVAA